MDYWPSSLKDLLEEKGVGVSNIRDRISLNFLLEIFLDLVKSIDALHKNDIIHRDIKPENVLINDKKVQIIDFGLSCKTSAKGDEHNKIINGNLTGNIGTATYSSPEQLNSRSYDHRVYR